MIKTYGRRSGTPVLFQTKDPNTTFFSDNDDFYSDEDFKNATKDEINELHTQKDSINDTVLDNSSSINDNFLKKNIVNTIDSSNVENEVNSKSYDFLDIPFERVLKKRKKRSKKYHKTIIKEITASDDDDDSNDSQLMDNEENKNLLECLNNVKTFISNIKPIDDNVDILLNNHSEVTNTDNNNGILPSIKSNRAKLYGRNRTILLDQNKQEDEELSESDIEEEQNITEKINSSQQFNSSSITSDTSSQYIKTHNYSELKNMGTSLKYQYDLDFLLIDTNDPEVTEAELIPKFINFALLLENEDAFFEYVKKYRLMEIWCWIFPNDWRFYESNILTFFQIYLANKLQLPESEDIPDSCLNNILINILKNEKYKKQFNIQREKIKISKITRLNYNDFIKTSNAKSSFEYALNVLINYDKKLLYSNAQIIFTSLFELLTVSTNQILPQLDGVLTILNELLEQEDSELLTISHTEKNNLIDSLSNENLCSQYDSNTDFIKCIILLTNYQDLNLSPKTFENLFIDNLTCIIESLTGKSFNNDVVSLEIDLLILKLGLCLNIITYKQDWNIKELYPLFSKLQSKISTLLKQISTNEEKDVIDECIKPQIHFIYNMFCTNVAYFFISTNTSADKDTLNIIKIRLIQFLKETEEFNKSIFLKVSNALQKLN